MNDLKPNFYFKGIEYLNEDHVGNFIKEKNLCKKNNIKIKFVGKKIFSSSKILFDKYYNRSDKEFEKYIIDTKKKEINFEKIIKKISNLKILLFGEIIFDKYTYVKINGVSSKASALSSSIISSKNMAGGILLSSNFLHQFSKKIDVLSLMNQDVKKNNQLFKLIKNKKNLIFSKSFPTILKERFIQTEKNTVSKKKLLNLNNFENIKFFLFFISLNN